MVSAKIAAICLAVAAVLMLSACAEANSLWYQEDFEGGSDPQPITAAPFNWLAGKLNPRPLAERPEELRSDPAWLFCLARAIP